MTNMRHKQLRLVVLLKGGLGNQMFQYAAGRSLALRNKLKLVLETSIGFRRDKKYARQFALGSFPIINVQTDALSQLPFGFERAIEKLGAAQTQPVIFRPWGIYLLETEFRFLDEVHDCMLSRNTWMNGCWQCEDYFSDCRDIIASEFETPNPTNPHFLSMAQLIESCNSVAVCVRCYEEIPDKERQNWVILPPSFYEEASQHIAQLINDPVFFVFTQSLNSVVNCLKLPGNVHILTEKNGFDDALQTLFLITRCRHHIISNSSFYWWGAWLAERRNPGNLVLTSKSAWHRHTVPERWISNIL